jgi:hypothetical protein
MIRILTLVVLLMVSSCEKDEIILNKVSVPPKVVEVKKKVRIPSKKRKFRLFKRKKYKVVKSCLQTY